MHSTRLAAAVLALTFAACGGAAEHGRITSLSSTATDPSHLCEHEVPADVCVRCNPELTERFRAVGDWCGPHSVPESQCLRCHPELDFTPPAELDEHADYADLSQEQALALEANLAPGKVTVVDFFAEWCAPCHNLDRHLRARVLRDREVAVRRVDVGAWEGPVYDRYLTRVAELPYVRVYGRDGGFVGELAGFDNDELDALIDGALQR